MSVRYPLPQQPARKLRLRPQYYPQVPSAGAISADLAGTTAAQGTTSGNLTATALLSGTSAGQSVTAGAVIATALVSGVSAGQGTTTGALTARALATGTSASTGTTSGALTATASITGTSAAQGVTSGALTARSLATGTSAGQGTTTGAVTAITTYYIKTGGSDVADGLSDATAWATVSKVNSQTLHPGDTVQFRGGDTFSGTMLYIAQGGTSGLPITITSYGTGRATIANTGGFALYSDDVPWLEFRNLIVTGGTSGQTAYESGSGIGVYRDLSGRSAHIVIDNCDISGFANGISIGGASGGGYQDVTVSNCKLHGCKNNGLLTYGPTWVNGSPAYANQNVTVTGTEAYDNLGDPANTTTNSGSGIVLGSVTTGLVDQCWAHGNGASCNAPQGPVGIWTYNSNAVTIRRCSSYSNRTAQSDGDGFDIDLNSTNCIVERCVAYDNDGGGILVFGATGNNDHSTNTVRWNLCWGNGRDTDWYGEITVGGKITQADIYHNTLIARDNGAVHPPAIAVHGSGNTNIRARNNILYAASGHLITTDATLTTGGILFQGNDYYRAAGFSVLWNATTYSSYATWRAGVAGEETYSAAQTGYVGDPLIFIPDSSPTVTDPTTTTGAIGLRLRSDSPILAAGIDLATEFGTNIGTADYFGATPVALRIGATVDTVASLSGTTAGQGTDAGALAARMLLSGTSAGQGTTAGTVTATGTAVLTGTTAATGSTTGNLVAPPVLSGTSAAQGTTSGALVAQSLISGTSAGQGTTTGTVTTFPTTAILDNFNRADGSIGGNWSVDPYHAGSTVPYTIVGNLASGSAVHDMWYNAASFANVAGLECYLTMTSLAPKASLATANGHFLGFVQQPSASVSTGDGYVIGAVRVTGTNTDKAEIYKATNSTWSTLTGVTLATDWVIGDVLGMELMLDGTINVYRNGQVVATTNDTTYFHAGESAFLEVSSGGAVTFDDFGGGSVYYVTAAALSGTSSGQGATTGNLIAPPVLSGATVGSGTTSGAVTARALATGTAAGTGTTAGTLVATSVLSGTSAAQGTASGNLIAPPVLSGTSAGQGITSGAAQATSLVSGTAAGTGTAAGNLIAPAVLSGTLAGQGTTSGNVTVPGSAAISGTSAGQGTTSGSLTARSLIAGTSAGQGTTSGALTVTMPLAGTSAGTGTSTGALTALTLLSGTSAGTGSTTGTVSVTQPLAGTSVGQGTTSGAATARSLLTGASAGQGTTTGNVTVPGAASLSGASAGQGATSANVTATSLLTGTSASQGTTTGAATATAQLAGTGAGAGSTSGAAIATALLAGTSAGQGGTTGAITARSLVSGLSVGQGATTGALVATAQLAGTSTAQGTTTGNITTPGPAVMAGTSAGQGTVTGQPTIRQALTGTSAGQGTTTGLVTITQPLAGTVVGTGSTTGNVRVYPAVAGTSDGSSTVAGAVGGQPKIAGTSDGAGLTIGGLRSAPTMTGITLGSGIVIGFLRIGPEPARFDGTSMMVIHEGDDARLTYFEGSASR